MAFGPAPLPSIGLLFDSGLADPGLFTVYGPRRYGSDPFPVTHATFLLVGRKLVAEHGTFTLTGQDATTTKGTPVPLAPAAPLPFYSLAMMSTGSPYRLYASTGTFTLNGQPLTFRKGRALIAEAGSFTFSGAPAEVDMELDGDAGYFSVNGQIVDLKLARKLSADYGTFTLTGQPSTGTIESTGNRKLTADVGLFIAYGPRRDGYDPFPVTHATFLTVGRRLLCETGAFTVAGFSPLLEGPLWVQVGESDGTWSDVAEASTTWADA